MGNGTRSACPESAGMQATGGAVATGWTESNSGWPSGRDSGIRMGRVGTNGPRPGRRQRGGSGCRRWLARRGPIRTGEVRVRSGNTPGGGVPWGRWMGPGTRCQSLPFPWLASLSCRAILNLSSITSEAAMFATAAIDPLTAPQPVLALLFHQARDRLLVTRHPLEATLQGSLIGAARPFPPATWSNSTTCCTPASGRRRRCCRRPCWRWSGICCCGDCPPPSGPCTCARASGPCP